MLPGLTFTDLAEDRDTLWDPQEVEGFAAIKEDAHEDQELHKQYL